MTATSTQILNSKHYQDLTGKRGLHADWVIANCRSVIASDASQYLGYTAQSDGIMLEGSNKQKQFKPEKPWKAGDDTRAPKYRSQTGEYDAMLPLHPLAPNYWEDIEALKKLCWTIEEHPTLVITEGFFKAVAGCSNNIPTIALLGVEMGLSSAKADPQGKRYLVPVLEKYAKAGFGFIKSAYGEDLIDSIRASISMLLDPTAPYGFFIHLIGPSGSGKGTLLRLLKDMFGLEHSRSGDFKNLSTTEGRHQYLTGAALFTVPDVGGYIQGLKPFYELVDNGSMSGRALFSSSGYDKIWNTRFIIASVDHLQIENSGDGWDRRCIPLPTKPRAGIQDPDLSRKLADVKADIISWALAMPREERDRILLHPSSNERVINLKQEATIQGVPIRAFADLCLRPASLETQVIYTHDLHSKFFAFAQAHGYQGWGMSKFASHLKTILPIHYVPRRRGAGRSYVSAHWAQMAFVFGVFVEGEKTTSLDPDWKCNKSRCVEGGLTAFAEFRNSSSNLDVGSSNPPKLDEPQITLTESGFQESPNNVVHPVEKVDEPPQTFAGKDFQKVVHPVHPGGGLPLDTQS